MREPIPGDRVLDDPAVRRALGAAAPAGLSAAFGPDARPDALVTALARAAAVTRALGPGALDALGIRDEDLPAAIGPVVLVDESALPSWARTLVSAIEWWAEAEQPTWPALTDWFVGRALDGVAVDFGPLALEAIAGQALSGGVPGDDPRTLLLRAPARAYAMAHVLDRTAANAQEFAQRLEHDRPEVARLIGGAADVIVDLALACGDPHDGLRSVSVVTFASGAKVAYKTKDLRVQQLWNDVVAMLGEDFATGLGFDGPPDLPLLAREGYAWVCFVEQGPARDDPAATSRFMARMGGLAAAAALLRANDLWGDNLVTVQDQPTIIDLETMLLPPMGGLVDLPSIMSGVVAMPVPVHPDLPSASLGALTYDAAIASGIEAHGSTGHRGSGFDTVTSTDGSGRSWVSMVMDERRPTIDGLPPDLFEWWPDFESGYRCAMVAFERQAPRIRELLERHAADRSRMIVQGTFDYYRAMYASWNGRYDDDTRRRTLALIRTMKSWHRGRLLGVPSLAWVEGVMLADGDVPYFTTRADARDLFAGDASLGELAQVSGRDAVLAALSQGLEADYDLRALRAHASTDIADHRLPTGPVAEPARSWESLALEITDTVEAWLAREQPLGLTEQPESVLRAFGPVPFDVWNGGAAAALLLVEAGRDADGSRLAERIVADSAQASTWSLPVRGPWMHPVSGILVGLLSGTELGRGAARTAAVEVRALPFAAAGGPRPADGLGDTDWSHRVLLAAGGSPLASPTHAVDFTEPYWGRLPTASARRRTLAGRDPAALRTEELIALGEVPGQARAAAGELARRQAATGRWLGDRLADDDSMMSGIWGLVGVARTLLRAEGHRIPAFRDPIG